MQALARLIARRCTARWCRCADCEGCRTADTGSKGRLACAIPKAPATTEHRSSSTSNDRLGGRKPRGCRWPCHQTQTHPRRCRSMRIVSEGRALQEATILGSRTRSLPQGTSTRYATSSTRCSPYPLRASSAASAWPKAESTRRIASPRGPLRSGSRSTASRPSLSAAPSMSA
jgi:hypothetical protein